ncbi:MAG TPA: cupredoxin domain-containing protein [Mycobacteriales bacterium]|nr:cupredoxin domain-containing protein [Mycobacteriales bacterium]
MSARFVRLLAACVAVPLLLATACSNRQPIQAGAPQRGDVTVTPGPDGVQDVTVRATAEFRFVPATVHAKVGRIHLTLRIQGGTPHNLTFDTLDAASIPTTSAGRTRSSDFTVSTPGRYRFVCTIHESLNQTGALVVSR